MIAFKLKMEADWFISILPEYVCEYHMPYAHKSQKSMSDFLKLELQAGMSCHVDAGKNSIPILRMWSQCALKH